MLIWKVLGCWLGAAIAGLAMIAETESLIPHQVDWNTVFNGLTLLFTIAITVVGVLVKTTVGAIKEDIDQLAEKQAKTDEILTTLREKVAAISGYRKP